MARKRRAEKEEKATMDLLGGSSSDSEPEDSLKPKTSGFGFNEEYARRFEHNKRREEYQRLQEKHPEVAARLKRGEVGDGDGDEEETTTSEDESGDDLISRKESEDMLRTLVKIKNRDPSIYDSGATFYGEGGEEGDGEGDGKAKERKRSKKAKNANTLRGIMARRALEEGAEALARDDDSSDEGDDNGMTYNQEQEQVRRAFTDAAATGSDDDEDGSDSSLDGLQQIGGGVGSGDGEEGEEGGDGSKRVTQDLLDEYFGKEDAMAEKDKHFLRDYIMNDGWKRQGGDADSDEDAKFEVDDWEDERDVEEAETFENRYNFRYEEPDSAKIETFPRVIESSIRKKESKRKRQRESKAERVAKRKEEEALEVKRLKNLKKAEIRDKLEEIRKVSGLGDGDEAGGGLGADLLEGDFDPETFDKSLEKIFGDRYYDGQDEDLEREKGAGGTGSRELDDLLAEYESIGFEDTIAGGAVKTRFKYREVSANNFG